MSTVATPRAPTSEQLDNMSVPELQAEYMRLRRQNRKLAEEEASVKRKIEQLREDAVRYQRAAEIEEEYATIQLLRRVEDEERNAAKARALLQEEEQANEALRKRMAEVRRERTEVENTIEEKQEYQLMQLQQKLMETARKKAEAERQLTEERQQYLELLDQALVLLRGEEAAPVPGVSPEARSSVATPPAEASLNPSGRPSLTSGVFEGRRSLTGTPSPALSASQISSSQPALAPASSQTHVALSALQVKLTTLLAKEAADAQRAAESENRVAELSENLKEAQQQAFLYRARVAKCKEELAESRKELAQLQDKNTAETFTRSDSSPSSNRSTSELQSMSLRDRTKELLSLSTNAATSPCAPPGKDKE